MGRGGQTHTDRSESAPRAGGPSGAGLAAWDLFLRRPLLALTVSRCRYEESLSIFVLPSQRVNTSRAGQASGRSVLRPFGPAEQPADSPPDRGEDVAMRSESCTGTSRERQPGSRAWPARGRSPSGLAGEPHHEVAVLCCGPGSLIGLTFVIRGEGTFIILRKLRRNPAEPSQAPAADLLNGAAPHATAAVPARPRAGLAAALLAAAAPLAASLATSPATVAFTTTAPPAVHSRTHAAALLSTGALPATACSPCDPKIPAMVGD